MTRAVLLDSGPLGQVVHPRRDSKITKWLKMLQEQSYKLRVPEIADYEVRRELVRLKRNKSINRLNQLARYNLIPLDTDTMRTAAELWANIRTEGQPTASDDSLDGDVILAAQAILQLNNFDEVVVVTTNLNHISRFESAGIQVQDWQQILDNLDDL